MVAVSSKYLSLFEKYKIFIGFREEGNLNDERKSSVGCLPHTPDWGASLKPRHVPFTGIKQ